MLNSALLDARNCVAPIAPTLSERDIPNPAFARANSLFELLPTANDNPRSLEEELALRLASAQRELSVVSMYLTPEFRRGAMRQLSQLFDVRFWDEDEALPNLDSIRSFARAMAVLRPSAKPMLGLSSNGNLLAMWGSETNRLSFEHLPADQVKWFVRSRAGDENDVAAGTTIIGRISRIVEAHDLNLLLYGAG
jgi:hypothetical protein